jgi:hypothetical protein
MIKVPHCHPLAVAGMANIPLESHQNSNNGTHIVHESNEMSE